MNEFRMRRAQVALSAAVAASAAFCLAGPLAMKLGIAGAWLFLWPAAFWLIRLLSFSVFPLARAGPLWTNRKRRIPMRWALSNLIASMMLAGTVVGIERWSRRQAMASDRRGARLAAEGDFGLVRGTKAVTNCFDGVSR